jgi:hypothetical protein
VGFVVTKILQGPSSRRIAAVTCRVGFAAAQREIEKVVRQALAEGKLKGNERFPAEATVTLGGIGLSLEIKGDIELE